MDKGVGVDALHGASGGEGERLFSANGAGGGKAEDGAKAFPAGEEAIAHGLMNEGWMGAWGNEAEQSFFDDGEARFPKEGIVHGKMS